MSLAGVFKHFSDRLLDLIYEFLNFLFGDGACFFNLIELGKDSFLFVTECVHVLYDVLGRSEAFHKERCGVHHHFKSRLTFRMNLNELFFNQLVLGVLRGWGWDLQELLEWHLNLKETKVVDASTCYKFLNLVPHLIWQRGKYLQKLISVKDRKLDIP